MKKIATIIMLLAMVLSILSGCGGLPKNLIPKSSASQSDNDDNDDDDADASENDNSQSGNSLFGNSSSDDASSDDASSYDSDSDESLTAATNPSEGFSNYMSVKGDAYDRAIEASEASDELMMAVGMSYLGIAMVDLSMIGVTFLSEDLTSSEMAMSMLGMKDGKITKSGKEYTLTYTDQNGDSIKQTCSYDAAKDQMTSVLYDGDGEMSIFFEYVNLGDAYVSQYFSPTDDGFEITRCYFDLDSITAFGITTESGNPASIIGQNNFGADFVLNDQSYLIFENGDLTVFDDGTITTN